MPAFYIAPEASIKYTFVGPSGARAVINDPSDPDFVGYLDGDEAISGIESPELRDSYADLADKDGGMAGTNFYSRRPIVMNGKVFPTSAADRNTKLGKLMAATDARFADGTLTWTPSGGEPVFVKFRRQLPFRAKGGFNKEFMLGLVCADPRIYTVRAFTQYTETNGNSVSQDFRRFTWASGSATSYFASRSFYLPPGTYKVSIPVKSSQVGYTLQIGHAETVVGHTNAVANGSWQTITATFNKSSIETTPAVMGLFISTALFLGNYIEVGDPVVESAAGLYPSNSVGFATNWAAASGYNISFVTASPPSTPITGYINPGNTPAPLRCRLLGPFGSVAVSPMAGHVLLGASPAYYDSDYLVIDYGYKTVTKNNTASAYGIVDASSPWGGVHINDTYSVPAIWGYSGCTTTTRMETTWRGTWL